MANKKNRTLVKLDDKIVEIVNGKKGLQARALTDNDLLEVTLLDEGVDKFIENDINKLANEAYTELQKSFKDNLKKNVLKVIGFDKHWANGWEVDHCNGRQSLLTDFISGKVKQMFTEEFNKMLQPEIEAMLVPVRKQIAKEFKETFVREASRHMRAEAETAARAFMQDVLSKQMTKHQKKAIEKAELAFLGRQASEHEDESDD
jgi:hypothetical protein